MTPRRQAEVPPQLTLGPNCWGFSISSGFPQDTPTLAFEAPQEPEFGLEPTGEGRDWAGGL